MNRVYLPHHMGKWWVTMILCSEGYRLHIISNEHLIVGACYHCTVLCNFVYVRGIAFTHTLPHSTKHVILSPAINRLNQDHQTPRLFGAGFRHLISLCIGCWWGRSAVLPRSLLLYSLSLAIACLRSSYRKGPGRIRPCPRKLKEEDTPPCPSDVSLSAPPWGASRRPLRGIFHFSEWWACGWRWRRSRLRLSHSDTVQGHNLCTEVITSNEPSRCISPFLLPLEMFFYFSITLRMPLMTCPIFAVRCQPPPLL